MTSRVVTDRIGVPTIEFGHRDALGTELQQILVDLIALSLAGKQGHWHVTGEHFVPVHEQLDRIVEDARSWSDQVAERAVTLGLPVDGRPETVAKTATIEPPQGWLDGRDAVRLAAEWIAALMGQIRARLEDLGRIDLVTQDLVLEIMRGLEKHHWMLMAQLV